MMSVSSISRFEELKASLDALYHEVNMIMSYSEIENSEVFQASSFPNQFRV